MKFDRTVFVQKFVSETRDNIRRLNEAVLKLEQQPDDPSSRDTFMRVAHTIKGSAKMLNYQNISRIAHALESAAQAVFRSEITEEAAETFLRALDRLTELTDSVTEEKEAEADITETLLELDAVAGGLRREPKEAIDQKEFISKFVMEAGDLVQTILTSLQSHREGSKKAPSYDVMQRASQTLKGAAQMLKLDRISQIAQALENLFQALHKKRVQPEESAFHLMQKTTEFLRDRLHELKATGREGNPNTALLDALEQACAGRVAGKEEIDEIIRAPQVAPPPVQPVLDVGAGADRLGERLIQAGFLTRDQLVQINRTTDSRVPLGERLIAMGVLTRDQLDLALKEQRAVRELLGHKTDRDETLEDVWIQVDLQKLDHLIKDSGEMMTHQVTMQDYLFRMMRLYRSMRKWLTVRLKASADDEETARVALTLTEMDLMLKRMRDHHAGSERLINEIQDVSMRMRMVPLRIIFDAYPRAVRDLAKSLDKKIRLEIEGGGTELDRRMVEKLNEPMIHLLRNAIDHGIEPPQQRRESGKPEEGRLVIRASNEGHAILIQIEDDGQGIPFDKIKQRALQKNLIKSVEDWDRLSEGERIQLIFLPGFSTSDLITDISGRGYGMDIVKSSIEKLKGSISVESKGGVGTRISIHLPLTVTSLRALFVRCGDHRFAIPITSVYQTLRITAADRTEVVGKFALRIRNQLIPLVALSDVMELPGVGAPEGEEQFVVIVQDGSERSAMIVDDVMDERDVIVKSLPAHMARIRHVSSATIAADQNIVLLLHVPDIVAATKEGKVRAEAVKRKEKQTILVVDDSLNTREVEKTILQAYGYEVDTAKDGMEALEKLKAREFQLVVTDVEMPLMDGFTLTARIKEESSYRHIPVVIVTSRESMEDKRRGVEVGANAYIIKGSFDQNNLIHTVESLIG